MFPCRIGTCLCGTGMCRCAPCWELFFFFFFFCRHPPVCIPWHRSGKKKDAGLATCVAFFFFFRNHRFVHHGIVLGCKKKKKRNDPRGNRTLNLRDWNPTRCHCAMESFTDVGTHTSALCPASNLWFRREQKRGDTGIEPATSCTQSRNHTTRPITRVTDKKVHPVGFEPTPS
jgi:hypothetical protein